jgi:DNA-binding NtrC family response regulator
MQNPITILFVDDDPAILRLVGRLLAADPFDVLTAASGAEALEMLARQRVDVLVSDLEMPEMGGLELVREARQRFPDTLRMLLTGAATLEAALEAINQGEVARFLRKPLDPDAFREVLESLADRIERNRVDEQSRSRRARHEQLVGWVERRFPGVTAIVRDEGGRVLIDLPLRLMAADDTGSGARDALFRWSSFAPPSGPRDTLRSPTSR